MKLSRQTFNKVEVSYLRVKESHRYQEPHEVVPKTHEKERIKTKDIVRRFEMFPSSQSALFSQERVKDISKWDASKSENKQPIGLKGATALKSERKISVPVLKSEKITNVKYVSYNESIRQKIRQQAYKYAENPDFQSGEVYLTFVLGSDGQLKDIKIIEDKTRANTFLRNVGLRSVREASPFAAFPKDLMYPELTFNVVISFEVKE